MIMTYFLGVISGFTANEGVTGGNKGVHKRSSIIN